MFVCNAQFIQKVAYQNSKKNLKEIERTNTSKNLLEQVIFGMLRPPYHTDKVVPAKKIINTFPNSRKIRMRSNTSISDRTILYIDLYISRKLVLWHGCKQVPVAC